MDRATWRSLSDANLAESHREFARWHPEGEILERGGLLLTRGADRYAGVNFAMRTAEHPDPRQVIRRAAEFFAPRADGFAVRTRGHADADLIELCKQDDMFLAGENIGLMRREPITQRPMEAGVELRLVESEQAAEGFATVAVEAFATIGLPEQTAARIFHEPKAMLAPHIAPMIAYVDERPAATALGLLSHGIAGLYWVGTSPWARGRGLARHVTTATHNRALSLGARAVMLQTNGVYVGFYDQLGYETIARYPWYLAAQVPPVPG